MNSPKTKKDRDKILKCLAEAHAEGAPFLWVREISRRTKINLGTVTWILYRYLHPNYVEFPAADPLIEQGLKIKPIKLKDEIFEKMTGAQLGE